MVRLLELALADKNDICQVLAHRAKELRTNRPLASEQTEERVLIVARLLLKRIEILPRCKSAGP